MCPDSCPQPGLPVPWAPRCPSSPPLLQCSAYPWGRPVPTGGSSGPVCRGTPVPHPAQAGRQLGHRVRSSGRGLHPPTQTAVAHQERLPGGARWQEGVPAPSIALAWARLARARPGPQRPPNSGNCRLVGAGPRAALGQPSPPGSPDTCSENEHTPHPGGLGPSYTRPHPPALSQGLMARAGSGGPVMLRQGKPWVRAAGEAEPRDGQEALGRRRGPRPVKAGPVPASRPLWRASQPAGGVGPASARRETHGGL